MNEFSHEIFNHALLSAHRSRAVKIQEEGADFLWQEITERMLDKLADIKRSFPFALEIGSHHGALGKSLEGKFGIRTLVQAETNRDMLACATSLKLLMHPELLPFKENSFDLILSIGMLHWVNDLPGMLAQIRYALKPDGFMLTMFPGGETLKELRHSLYIAMEETTGGITPRMSPMIDVRDAASLMQRAGFALPVVDREQITVEYSSPIKLLSDLRAMGQTNALIEHGRPLTRKTLTRMVEIYCEQFPTHDGGVYATFDIICLSGWKPDASQPKPKLRGSATENLKDWL